MRSRLAPPLLVGLVVAFAAGLFASAPAAAGASESRVAVRADLALAVVAELNDVRRAHGLRPLRISSRLTRAANAHARSMEARGFFAHSTPRGETFGQRIRRFYAPTASARWGAGENLLWASPDIEAAAAVQLWLESPPHRRNLLDRGWTEIGIGALTSQSAAGFFGGARTTIVVAEFGRPR